MPKIFITLTDTKKWRSKRGEQISVWLRVSTAKWDLRILGMHIYNRYRFISYDPLEIRPWRSTPRHKNAQKNDEGLFYLFFRIFIFHLFFHELKIQKLEKHTPPHTTRVDQNKKQHKYATIQRPTSGGGGGMLHLSRQPAKERFKIFNRLLLWKGNA